MWPPPPATTMVQSSQILPKASCRRGRTSSGLPISPTSRSLGASSTSPSSWTPGRDVWLAGATPQAFRVYDVVDHGTKLANRRTFITVERGGIADGLRVDVDGNLWCGWGGGAGNDGVMIFNPAGKLIGRIDLPERCANVCFGGFRRSRRFMAASHSLYAVFLRTQGVPGG